MIFWPMVPFVVLLGTRLRWGALTSAAAGIAVALPLIGFFELDGPAICAALSLLMAVAESVVASIVLRGSFGRTFFHAAFAHAAWLWIYFGADARPADGSDDMMFVLVTAMVGATGATLGAFRKR